MKETSRPTLKKRRSTLVRTMRMKRMTSTNRSWKRWNANRISRLVRTRRNIET